MSENISNNIPELKPVPEFLQGDNWFEEEVNDDFLDFAEPYRPPRYTLERNGIPFADVGELHIISGKPGNGKTGLMSQLMAATLSGQHGNTLRRDVPHKVIDRETGKEEEKQVTTVLLYIDTEQGKDDTIAIKNRVCSLAGFDVKTGKKEGADESDPQQFYILRLRDTEDATERWRKILKAIYTVNPTDIFLDGMLDIVRDYNDQVECQPIVRKCMKLATYYDASLWAVLHENPMVDKLVGTLGSITQRKVSEIFTVQKVKQTDLKETEKRSDLPDIYFKVKQVKARGRDVGDWLFEYVTSAGGWGQPIEIEESGERIQNIADRRRNELIQECDDRFKAYQWTSGGATYSELENHIRTSGVTSNRKIKTLFDTAKEEGIIYTTGNKGHFKYHYKGLNKEMPEDEPLPMDFAEPEKGPLPF